MIKKTLFRMLNAIAISYFPLVVILSAISASGETEGIIKLPFILIFLLFFIASLPFFVVYLDICKTVGFIFDRKNRNTLQKVLRISGLVFTVGVLASLPLSEKIEQLPFVIAAVLVVIWITEAIVNRKQKSPTYVLNDKKTWLIALIIIIVISAVFFALEKADESKNKPDPEAPTVCIGIYGIE